MDHLDEFSSEVSVVIPMHNDADTIAQTIHSVQLQSCAVQQIIVVDDGSNDQSAAIVAEMSQLDSRIFLLHLEGNGHGPAFARNRGVEQATGSWVAFLDADDRWAPDHIHFLARTLENYAATTPNGMRHDIGMLFADFEDVYPDRRSVRARPTLSAWPAGKPLLLEDFISIWINDRDCPVWTGAACLRRDLVIELGMFPERCRRGEDKDLWLRMISMAGALYQPIPTAEYYRRIAGNVSSVASLEIPCIIPTIATLSKICAPREKALLSSLRAEEKYLYAFMSWRRGQKISWSHYMTNPLRFPILSLKIALMSFISVGFIRRLAFWR